MGCRVSHCPVIRHSSMTRARIQLRATQQSACQGHARHMLATLSGPLSTGRMIEGLGIPAFLSPSSPAVPSGTSPALAG